MKNMKIDIVDLIRRILHQWKLIVIVTLACGLVFEGIGYARAYIEYRRETQGIEEEEDNTADQYLSELEEIEEKLTEREIAEAKVAATAYAAYITQYQDELLYCQDAIKMQLDSNQVPTYTLHYTVSNLDEETQIANQVVSVLSDSIINEGLCEEIRSALGWDTELGYIEELIELEAGGIVSENDTIMDILGSVNQMTIQIQAPDKESCETMAGVIKAHIEQEFIRLQEIYGEFETTLLSETYKEKSNNTLRSFQEGRYSALNTLRNAINTLPSNMTDDQQDYYYDLVAYNMVVQGEKSEELTLEDKVTDNEEDEVISPPGIIRTKFILLGLFLGLVLSCGYVFLRYILAKNLRVKEDLEDTFNLSLLGYLPANGKKQRFTKEERMEMICAGIRIAIQKEDLKSIYITGTAGDGESEKIMEQIQEALADSDAKISCGRDVACDPASLEQMTASDGVVFVERIDRSPYADIQKEVELCQMYNVPVIGSVVIE